MVLITWAIVSIPTTSLVLKVADFALPKLLPVKASTSSKLKLYFSASLKIAKIENTPTRLPTKLGVSFARITPLPNTEVIKVSNRSTMTGLVFSVGINSSKCMYLGGLKKCTPQKRSFKSSEKPFDNSVIDIPEVFVAKIAVEEIKGATFSYN